MVPKLHPRNNQQHRNLHSPGVNTMKTPLEIIFQETHSSYPDLFRVSQVIG